LSIFAITLAVFIGHRHGCYVEELCQTPDGKPPEQAEGRGVPATVGLNADG